MVKKNKKKISKEEDELDNPKTLIKESEKVISELVKELKECMSKNKPSPVIVNKTSAGIYRGTGSIKTSCTACRQRLWG